MTINKTNNNGNNAKVEEEGMLINSNSFASFKMVTNYFLRNTS
jgi:hypothetical protein